MPVPLETLKFELRHQLLEAESLRQNARGLPTGLQQLDEFLPWKGVPQKGLTALMGSLGLGGTEFWLRLAKATTQTQQWACWVQEESFLHPLAVQQMGVDLSRLLVVNAPKESKKAFFLLRELLSSNLFTLIGFPVPIQNFTRSQWASLKSLAEQRSCATILLAQKPHHLLTPHYFHLMMQLTAQSLLVQKCQQRPNIFSLEAPVSLLLSQNSHSSSQGYTYPHFPQSLPHNKILTFETKRQGGLL